MLSLLFYIIILGIIAYGLKAIPQIDETFRVVAYCVLLIVLVSLLFGAFGHGPAAPWLK